MLMSISIEALHTQKTIQTTLLKMKYVCRMSYGYPKHNYEALS